MLTAFWAPLALLGLHAFLESADVRNGPAKPLRVQLAWLALFGVSWTLQGAANGYFLVFFTVTVGVWILWFVVLRGRWRDLAMIALAGILAFLPLAAILARFVAAHARYGLERSASEITMFSADIGSFLCAPPHLALWSWMTLSACTNEEELFPGLTLIALCLAGLWIMRRAPASDSRVERIARYLSLALLVVALGMIAASASVAINGPWDWTLGPLRMRTSTTLKPFSRGVALLLLSLACSPAVWRAARHRSVPLFYAFAAAFSWALAWGPVPLMNGQQALETGPYAWLMLLPGLTGLRVPARFWMMAVLCLCVVMGVVLADLFRRRSAAFARAAVVVIGCALAIDGWAWIPAANLVPSAPVPDAMDHGIVLTLPLGEYLDFDAQAQLDAVVGGWSSVNGYSGYQPPHYWLLKTVSSKADPMILSPFLRRGNLNVVVHERAAEQVRMLEQQQGARTVGRRDGLRQFWIPARGIAAASMPAGQRYEIAAVSATCAENKVAFVLDGDRMTRWECGPQLAGQTITADLGRTVTVGMVVPGLGAFPNDFPRDVIVETSVDGVAWDEARRGEVFAEVIEAMLQDSKAMRATVAFPPRRARYIRLRLTSSDTVWYWSIAELEVWSGANGST